MAEDASTRSQDPPAAPAKKSRFKLPSAYTILFALIILVAILTWIIPAGKYDKDADGSPIPGTYHEVESTPQKVLVDSLKAPITGMYGIESPEDGSVSPYNSGTLFGAIDVALFIIVIGGFLGITMKTGAIQNGIARIVRRMRGREKWMIPILMGVFALGGTTYGMAEESLAFYALIITVMIAAGYDALTGASIVLLGAGIGVIGSTVNPFATGIASGFAGVPLSAGLIGRLVILIVGLAMGILFVMRYAERVRLDPSRSLVYDMKDQNEAFFKAQGGEAGEEATLTGRQKAILVVFALAFGVMIYGVIPWQDLGINIPTLWWWFPEMTASFVLFSIVIGLIAGMGEGELTSTFVDGARDLLGVALIIGIARGITVIMNNGQITDTVLYWAEQALGDFGKAAFAIVMYVLYLPLSFLIPSSSGLATVTMPIMAPLAGFAEVPEQVVVTAYQSASGLTNLVSPTFAVVMGGLAIARVPYGRYLRFVWPLLAMLAILSVVGAGRGGVGGMMNATTTTTPSTIAPAAADAAKLVRACARAGGRAARRRPARGLSSAEALYRLEQHGPNRLVAKKEESGLHAFLRMYQDFMQIILVAAAVVSLVVTGDVGTTIVLVVLTMFNAILGLRGESKAAASLAALQKTLKNTARVRRDGEAVEIDSEQLVPGDVVLVEAGNRVPADGRLFLAATLEIEEAALTGESTPTLKDTDAIDGVDVAIGDRHCLAFMNTSVTRGRGEMIVTTTEHGHRDRPHRRHAQQDRGRPDAAPEATRSADHRHRLHRRRRLRHHAGDRPQQGPAVRRALRRRGGLGHRGHSLRPAGSRHHALLGGHAGAGEPERDRQAAAVGGDPRVGVGHLLGQDRHPDAQQDDRARVHGPRAQPLLRSPAKATAPRDSCCMRAVGPSTSRPCSCPWRCARTPASTATELIGDPTEGALIVLAAKGGLDLDGVRDPLPAHRRGALRLGLQVHGHLPRDDRREGTPCRALLREGRPGRADRAGRLLLAPRR